jgi:rSAM/selenodomain-associated transferase 1
MEIMNAVLIIFAKEPRPGQVKTRLCPPLSLETAARLYTDFLADVMEEMRRVPRLMLALAYAPATAGKFFQDLAPEGVILLEQQGHDLGERLSQAFAWGFAAGFEQVIIRNSDSPDLPGEIVAEAQQVLAKEGPQVVLGPCPDGGYYLVGLNSPSPKLFQAVAWSTATVLADTLGIAGKHSWPVHLLPAWLDIDTYPDLLTFLSRPHPSPSAGWRSHRYAETLSREWQAVRGAR